MYIEKDKIDSLAQSLLSFGFTKNQTRRFLSNTKKNIGVFDNIEKSYTFYHEKMLALGYTEYELHELACRSPKVLNYKFCLGKLKTTYDEYIKSLSGEKREDDENTYFEFNKVREILENLGLPSKRIDFIFSKNAKTVFMDPKEIETNIEFFYSCGLSDAKLAYLLKRHVNILEYSEDMYKESFSKMKKLGFTKKDFGKLFFNVGRSRRLLLNENFSIFLDFISSHPFDYSKLRKNIIKHASITTLPKTVLEGGFKNLLDLGFSDEESGYILSIAPSIITMSYDNLLYKMKVPLYVNCSEEDVHSMVVKFPGYLTQSSNNLHDKFEVYARYGLLNYILMKPKNIIQSAELVYLRAEYLNTYYKGLKAKSYTRMIFSSDVEFYNFTKCTKDDIKKVLKKQ